MFRFRMGNKNLKFVIEITQDLPKIIYVNGNRIRQVVSSLIGNAIKKIKHHMGAAEKLIIIALSAGAYDK